MTLKKKILFSVLAAPLVLILSIVIFIGPWPVYKDSHYRDRPLYTAAMNAMDLAIAHTKVGDPEQPLKAGWAVRELTPKIGTTMAGYGGRPNDKRSTGVHDPLFVKAVAFSDGQDTVVIVGADMLQTLPNLLALVEKRVAAVLPLTNRNIMYTTSHDHCGPGGLAPGLAAKISYGEYDPAVVQFLSDRFAEAIIESVNQMAPAKLANGQVSVPEYIKNRTRQAPTDATMNFAVIEQADGKRCYMARYSAHPTVYGQDMLEFTGEYPGAFQRAVEQQTGATMVYIGGAVGSMGPNPPEAPTESEQVEAMGQGLAKKLLEGMGKLEFLDKVDVASMASTFPMPQMQMRPVHTWWRVSPFVRHIFGVLPEGRMQAARIGGMMFVGMPYDFSGETSLKWQATAKGKGVNLWVTSHSGAYLGYLSPDEYYGEVGPERNYDQNYEMGLMNWFGPNQEAYMTDLFAHALDRLSPPVTQAAAAR